MSSAGGFTSPLPGDQLADLKCAPHAWAVSVERFSRTPCTVQEIINTLRQKVKEKMHELGVEREIHELVSVKGKSTVTKAAPTVSKEAAIEALKGHGVIEQLVKSLVPVPSHPRTKSDEDLKRSKRMLNIHIPSAKKLLPYLSNIPEQHEHLIVCAEIFGHRFRSLPITPSDAPVINTTFSVEVPGSASASTISLLSQRQKLHLVLLRTYPHDPASRALHGAFAGLGHTDLETEVLGTGHVDWREALRSPSQPVHLDVDLVLGGTWAVKNGPVVMCTIAVELEEHGIGSAAVEEGMLREKQEAERAAKAVALARYSEQAQASTTPIESSPGKLAKLLAYGEDCSLLPVCAFVKPLHLGRAIASPGEACQFVHLLEQRLEVEKDVFAGNLGESWSSLHTILASGLASPEDKALLLCGMLLGFCLDAWVAVGTHENAPKDQRLWVLTRGTAHQATFWDPVTGRRSSPGGTADGKPCPFIEIASVFSHRRLYINSQPGVLVAQMSFDFEGSSAWRDLGVQQHDLPALPQPRLELQVHTVDTHALEIRVEAELKKLLSERRVGLKLAITNWDDSLAFQLMPLLAAFEHEAIWGHQAGATQDFEQTIRRAVPAGSVFKGFPQNLHFVSPSRIMRAILREPLAVEILEAGAPEAVFALRIGITAYPERVFSLWLMLASCTLEAVPVMHA